MLPSSGSSYLLVSMLLLSPLRADTRSLYRRCCFLRNKSAVSVIPFVSVMRGALGDRTHLGQSNHISERDATLLPKTLKQ
ncbi:hypothetical protein MTR_1g009140 [Medicago truncatula]|uniref:Transmembrane protein n=1 Tax=Medicago truncatula TaxID=3880 RepID=G7I560_MEDTR|nr:hypothetical protein MTR_1g009140 [Medicago truncatula]